MNPKAFFEALGAPLKNLRWSWGSVRSSDGAVFLRVWEDRKRLVEGSTYVQVTHQDAYQEKPYNPGYRERQQHVDLVRAGAPTYLVMCEAVDTRLRPRSILRFDENQVFRGGRVIDLDGESWVEILAPVSPRKVAPGST